VRTTATTTAQRSRSVRRAGAPGGAGSLHAGHVSPAWTRASVPCDLTTTTPSETVTRVSVPPAQASLGPSSTTKRVPRTSTSVSEVRTTKRSPSPSLATCADKRPRSRRKACVFPAPTTETSPWLSRESSVPVANERSTRPYVASMREPSKTGTPSTSGTFVPSDRVACVPSVGCPRRTSVDACGRETSADPTRTRTAAAAKTPSPRATRPRRRARRRPARATERASMAAPRSAAEGPEAAAESTRATRDATRSARIFAWLSLM
jgi:hypothetical protein